MALHAESLSLLHPVHQTPLSITAPLPVDLRSVLAALAREHDDAARLEPDLAAPPAALTR